ncbi:MAG TPA: hypothetical protein VII73_14095 [Caulobacteraceae bacterium]
MAVALAFALFAGCGGGPARAGATRCWLENGALVVPAAFGDIAGDFILDLSAPRSLLHLTRAQADGIEASTARGELVVAGEHLADFPIEVADLDARSAGFATVINGVIGVDALAGLVVEVGFAPCALTLYRRPPRRLGGSVRWKIVSVDAIPTLAAAVSDGRSSRAGLFAIDTGRSPVAVAAAALSRPIPPGVDPTGRARLRALSVAGRLFEDLPADLMSPAPTALGGAIGNTVWSRFRMRLDLKRGWLDLAPAK